MTGPTAVGNPGDAVDFHLGINSDGSATLTVTMYDDRLEERLYALTANGATRDGDTWTLTAENLESITEHQAHIVGMVADVVAPKPLTDADRQKVFERDHNRCRLCGKDFDEPRIDDSDAREDVRIIDHIYPKADARDVHTPNEPVNLATVCGGCDDALLQGDSIRFVPSGLDSVLDRIDRQLLAWLQKRPLVRSDWLLDKMNESRGDSRQVTADLIEDRLLTFVREGLLRHDGDIAPEEAFDVYRVDLHSGAIAFKDTLAVSRHRTQLPNVEVLDNGETNTIGMDERISPRLPGLTGGA